MRRLAELTSAVLLIGALLANLLVLGVALWMMVGGPRELISLGGEGLPRGAQMLLRPLQYFERQRALSAALGQGLRVSDEAFAYQPRDTRPTDAGRRVLRVGPGRSLSRPSQAAAVARAGDVVELDPGDYFEDTAVWTTADLSIRGADGIAHLHGEGLRLPEEKAIWIIRADNIRLANLEFSGAVSRDRNGAGLRVEGNDLVVTDCYFHDNETGILTNALPDGSLRVEHSAFVRNGHGDGQAHQIYVNELRELVLRFNDFRDTHVGSAIKSRAHSNRIEFNRIVDGMTGSSNYSVDLSNGGSAALIGNVIEQGPLSGNYVLIAFAPEGARSEPQDLLVAYNTLVNDGDAGIFVWNHGATPLRLFNNLLLGAGLPVRGAARAIGNLAVADGLAAAAPQGFGEGSGSRDNHRSTRPAVLARENFDYALTPDSPAINAGARPISEEPGLEVPRFEYLHPRAGRARIDEGLPDVGAHARAR